VGPEFKPQYWKKKRKKTYIDIYCSHSWSLSLLDRDFGIGFHKLVSEFLTKTNEAL
jgi:hypothetical protein